MGKATKGTTARKQTKAATRWLDYQPLFGKGACAPPPNSLLGELVKENAAASDELLKRENDYGDFRNRVCFTFSRDNYSDILMLTEIIFD